jgi:hypothetical protein
MRNTVIIAVAAILFTAVAASAAPNEVVEKQLKGYPKNVARQHLGTNLFAFDSAKLSYEPTEAAAAWLDDDVSTGISPVAGKHYYLLALPEAVLLTNFMISADSSVGKISLYAGDEIAVPESDSWWRVVTDIPVSEINGKKMSKPYSRFAKYLLVETDLAEAGRWYSIYAYGERPAVEYSLEKRDEPIDTGSIFGPYCNDQTAINFSSLYAGARILEADHEANAVNWQGAIDDNPETFIWISSTGDRPGIVLKYGTTVSIERVSILTKGEAKGRLNFYLLNSLKNVGSAAQNGSSEYIKIANTNITVPPSAEEIDLSGQRPTATLILDGNTVRSSVDFPATESTYLLVQWAPAATGDSRIELQEMNSFSSSSLSTYRTGDDETSEDASDNSKDAKDGKTFTDYKDGKKVILPPVGEAPPSKNPFVPGALGFPPILNVAEVPTSP